MSKHAGRTALYRLYDDADRLLYVGISRNPDVRWGQHSISKAWWSDVAHRTVEWHDTRIDAETAERNAIRAERPQHNVLGAPIKGFHDTPRPSLQDYPDPTPADLVELAMRTAMHDLRNQHREAQRQEADALAEYHEAIADAADAGMKQVDIADATGFTREHIRKVRMAVNAKRAADAPPAAP